MNLQLSQAMKTVSLLILLVTCGYTAHAQYTIPWSKIAGGGVTTPSTGGVYAVRGTLGQPEAGGPLLNGQYAVTGGFWGLPTLVQTPGAPTLTVAAGAPGQAVISWSPATPGFVLQETPSLENPNWVNSSSGATNPVNVPEAGLSKFYRLRKP